MRPVTTVTRRKVVFLAGVRWNEITGRAPPQVVDRRVLDPAEAHTDPGTIRSGIDGTPSGAGNRDLQLLRDSQRRHHSVVHLRRCWAFLGQDEKIST
uniref:Uncharacterized protein n=1 Tax=Timema shepardi TaxID=629360 RepID=A0A7R9FWW8_TIMSH|nr:unnamed protein product [Timema shepardi]